MMIPARIRQIVIATAIVCAVALPCILVYDRGAGIGFAATSLWMMANFLIWAIVMRIVLQPGDEKPAVGIMLIAVSLKVFLLIGGIVALRIFAPYTPVQLYGILAGISSVLIISFLKALGSRVAALVSPAQIEKKRAAKV